MSISIVIRGLLLISCLFITILWFKVARDAIKRGVNSLADTKLILTGYGLVLQSVCLFAASSIALYGRIKVINVEPLVLFMLTGLIFADFLFIVAASLAPSKKFYLVVFVSVCVAWLIGNVFIAFM